MSVSLGDVDVTRLSSPPSPPVAARPQPPRVIGQSPRQKPPRHATATTTSQCHLSPRKLQQMQRAALSRSSPLSPLSPAHPEGSTPRVVSTLSGPVPWNPAWLPPEVLACHGGDNHERGGDVSPSERPWAPPRGFDVAVGTVRLREWVRQYEVDAARYESLDRLVQVKLPEALALADKLQQLHASTVTPRERPATPSSPAKPERLEPRLPQRQARPRDGEYSTRFHERFRVAVFAHLMDRAVLSLVQSAALSHCRSALLLVRRELLCAIYADYDEHASSSRPATSTSDGGDRGDVDRVAPTAANSPRAASDSELEPRALSFFLRKTPFAVKLSNDSRRRAEGFVRHELVLRRVIQALYRSLGSVFHAWKRFSRARRDERLSRKGAQLTAMVVVHRGLVRSTFVEWSRAALQSKVRRLQEREEETARVQQQEVADLVNEAFVLRDKNARLRLQLAEIQQRYALEQRPIEESDSEGDDDDGGWDPAVTSRQAKEEPSEQLEPAAVVDAIEATVVHGDAIAAPDTTQEQ